LAANWTEYYRLFYAGPNTDTSLYPLGDKERWQTVEVQLLELFTMFGNGAYPNSWGISPTVAAGPTIYIQPGSGHIYFKVAETTENSAIALVIPTGADIAAGVTYYIYGSETLTTHYDKSITFLAFTARQTNLRYIYLGAVTIASSPDTTSGYVVTKIEDSDRDEISILSTLTKMLNEHVHLGGTNPPKINLRTNVAGLLPGDFIESSIDAGQVTTGTFDPDRLPAISHNSLSDNGTLTHPQIDTLLASRTAVSSTLADIWGANELKMAIYMKKLFINFDEMLLNTFIYFPGVTSSEFVDEEGTTAIIDEANQQIVGILATPATSDFITWNGENEFQAEMDSYDLDIGDYPDADVNASDTLVRSENIVIRDGNVELDIPLGFRPIHARNSTVDWEVKLESEVTDAGPGGDVPVEVVATLYQFQRFRDSAGNLSPQNWGRVNNLQFGIELINPAVLEHGDVYFFLIGAALQGQDGRSVSVTSGGTTYNLSFSAGVKVLDSEEQTSEYPANMKVVNVDLLQWPTRTAVQGFGFYVSTTGGWVPGQNFQFSLHQPPYWEMDPDVEAYLFQADPYSVGSEGNITTYCYNDLYYEDNGFIILRYGQMIPVQYDFVYWDAVIPISPSYTTQPRIYVRTRTAQQEAALIYQGWDLVPETTHEVSSATNENIDIIVELNASGDGRFSPSVSSVTLYYTVSSSANSKSYSTAEQFREGLRLVNISVLEDPDRLEMTSAELVNAIYVIEGNSVNVLDEDKALIASLSMDGSTFYTSPRQCFAKVGAGFRAPRCIQVMEDGHIVVADTNNDRILDIDGDGNLYGAIQGNVYLPIDKRDFVALCGFYNDRLGKIFICFSQFINPAVVTSKFTLTTLDRTNSINFQSDEDATFTVVEDPDGMSAVLVIELSAYRKQQVSSWESEKLIIISQGGITEYTTSSGSSGSTGGMIPTGGTGTGTGTGAGAGAGTPVGTLSVSISATEDDPYLQLELVDYGLGTLTSFDPAGTTEEETETTGDETTVFDFDGDGKIGTTLMDIDENTDVVLVAIQDADVVFANVMYPIYAQMDGDNNYVIGQAYRNGVTNVGMDESVIWEIADTVVSFDSQKVGNSTLLSGGTVLCASPKMRRVLEIVPETSSIIFSHTPKFTPMFSARMADGNTIVVDADEDHDGLNSRVYEIDSSQDVVREWGLGRLNLPTGIYILETGDWLISC